MKRLRHRELRDLTCPRHRVVYWQSCQKHFPTPHTELCISACCYHSLLKINTNTAWNIRGIQHLWKPRGRTISRWKSGWEKEREQGWLLWLLRQGFRRRLVSFCSLMPLHQTEWKETNLFVMTRVCMGSDLISFGDSAYVLSPDVDGL